MSPTELLTIADRKITEQRAEIERLEQCLRACEELLKGACEERDDLRERAEEFERDRNGVREQHSAIVSTARAIEHDRDGLKLTLEHANIALRTARANIDDLQLRAGKVRETLQGHYEMGDVDWPALFAELDAISPPRPAAPWLEGSLTTEQQGREQNPAGGDHEARGGDHVATSLSLYAELTRNDGPRIRVWEHCGVMRPGDDVELCVLELMRGMARTLLEPKLPPSVVSRLAVPDDIHEAVAEGLERERIMRPVGKVMVEIAGKVVEPIAAKHIEAPQGWLDVIELRDLIEGVRTTLAEQPAAVYLEMPRESAELLVRVADLPLMRQLDRTDLAKLRAFAIENLRETQTVLEAERPELPPGDRRWRLPAPERSPAMGSVAAAAAAREYLTTLRGRLGHASNELRRRAEPAPEVDDVGAVCAVIAEDLEGIVAEIDTVLACLPERAIDVAVDEGLQSCSVRIGGKLLLRIVIRPAFAKYPAPFDVPHLGLDR